MAGFFPCCSLMSISGTLQYCLFSSLWDNTLNTGFLSQCTSLHMLTQAGLCLSDALFYLSSIHHSFCMPAPYKGERPSFVSFQEIVVSKEIIPKLLFLLIFFVCVWEEVEIWKTWQRVLMCKHQMNSKDFLLIKAHFPAHNSPQLGYTSPGHASKRRKNREASQKEVFWATKINLHLPTK